VKEKLLNSIIIMGRLTRDPELRRTGAGTSVANFCVAVDRDFSSGDGEKKTDFINCVAWRQIADFVTKYFNKGSMIAVDGRLEMRDWTDNDGNKRISAEVNADRVYFAGSKKSEDSGTSAATAPSGYSDSGFVPPPYPGKSTATPNFVELDDDDAQLPF
jgi:single-strand DNA-binding protein